MTNSDNNNVDPKGWQQGENPSRGNLKPEKTLRPDTGGGQDRVGGKGKVGHKDDLLQDDVDGIEEDELSGDQPDDPVTGEPRMREVERKRDGEESSD